MAREAIYMPKYGMTMTEGVIVEWHAQEGDHVNAGDPLLTVETEKVDTDIEAPVSGTLVEVRYAVNAEVPVGEIIAYIEH
jgi:pyruvate/2-oxoglutarate dehydrogenase complex dihydrolipoamide acyltransferase (E2) component